MSDETADELQRYRGALRVAVERTSLRGVAREVGISPGGVRGVIEGVETLHAKTRAKLRLWYATAAGAGFDGLPEGLARAVVERSMESLPARQRVAAQLEWLDALEAIHRRHRAKRPPWLAGVRRKLKEKLPPSAE